MKKLKKLSYEANMEKFRSEQGHFIDEMVSYVKEAEDKEGACKKVGCDFAEGVLRLLIRMEKSVEESRQT